jgi:hypothetical protein
MTKACGLAGRENKVNRDLQSSYLFTATWKLSGKSPLRSTETACVRKAAKRE